MGTSAGRDAMGVYLGDLARQGRIPPEAELELGAMVQAGRQARDTLDGGVADDGERRRLEQVAADGDRAHDELVRANLRLVVSVARRYQGRGVALADLVQEGNLGLIAAAWKFDPQRRCRFSTLAVWCIRQHLSRAVTVGPTGVRLPYEARRELLEVLHARREGRASPVGPERAAVLVVHGAAPVPLDDAETALVDEGSQVGFDRVERYDEVPAAELVDAHLARLSVLERSVLELRFGLGQGRPRCLDEVAELLGTSVSEVRVTESCALARLRAHRGAGDGAAS